MRLKRERMEREVKIEKCVSGELIAEGWYCIQMLLSSGKDKTREIVAEREGEWRWWWWW